MKIKNNLNVNSAMLRIIFILLLISGTSNLIAQISGDRAVYTTFTKYTTSPQDAIYVFCDQIGTGVGELKADSPDGTSGWTFAWTIWNSSTNDFATIIATENNQRESIQSNLKDGLYRVVISKSGETDRIHRAWVLNNSNNKPVLNLELMDCVAVHFKTSFTKNILSYSDYPSDTPIEVEVDDIVKFALNRGGVEILATPFPNYDGSDKSFKDQEAFDTEESYEMIVTDQYGCEFKSDPILSKTYVVKALFTIDEQSGEAEHTVKFSNNSINATEYQWYIYKDFEKIPESVPVQDSLIEGSILADLTEYTYINPGKYFVKLIASSDKGPETCQDVFMIENPIEVLPSLVDVANYFIPSKHGEWKIKTQSLKSFHAIIFNRWGRIVHEWKNESESWNGKVNGKMATPGTYFYVIKAVGLEEEKTTYTKKGSFTLIRK